jgi:uncharacterized protein YndB with AHSA1/START domain
MTGSEPGRRMRPVRVSAMVQAPPEAVFEFVSDSRNDPEWCPNVETVELVEGEGVGVGTRYRFHQHLDRPGGGRLQFDADLVVVAMGHHSITWQVTDSFQTRSIELTVAPEGSGSRVTQTTTATFLRPPGLARWLYPSLARRTFRDQFANLAARFGESEPDRSH